MINGESKMDALAEVRHLRSAGKVVPTALEIEALKHQVHQYPENHIFLARLCTLLRTTEGEAPIELEFRSIKLRISATPPDNTPVLTSLAQRQIQLDLQCGNPLSPDILEMAFAITPSEREVAAFLRSCLVHSSISRTAVRDLLKRARMEWPDSAMTLFFLARDQFDIEKPTEALRLLSENLKLTESADATFELYIRCLNVTQRFDLITPSLQKYFAQGDRNLWRSPEFPEWQQRAVARNIPGILLITQPKSGTVFTQSTLVSGLDAPKLSICARGVSHDYQLPIPSRCADLARGGAICAQHLDATESKLTPLRDAGLTRIVLNLRDVRQAALSCVHNGISDEVVSIPRPHLDRLRALHKNKIFFERTYLNAIKHWARFQEEWLNFIEHDDDFEILVTNFDELSDEPTYFNRILDHYSIPMDSFDQSALQIDKKTRAGHFRRGERREWESIISPETIERMYTILTQFPRVSAGLIQKDKALGI